MSLEVRAYEEDLLVTFQQLMINVRARIVEPPKSVGTVFCVHDLVGSGADFDVLARFLAESGYRVVCPDMPGRGESAYISDYQDYRVPLFGRVLHDVVSRYAGATNILIGKGWGAGLTLALLARARLPVSKLIITDLAPIWLPEGGTGVQMLIANGETTFATREEVQACVLATGELNSLQGPMHEAFLSRRVRRHADGFRLNVDAGVARKLAELQVRSFNLSNMLMGLQGQVMVLYGPRLSSSERSAVEAISTLRPQTQAIDALTEDGPVHFVDFQQILLTLGFLGERSGRMGSFDPAGAWTPRDGGG